jgi:hypothetical protein
MQSKQLFNNLESIVKEKIFEYPVRQAQDWQRNYKSLDYYDKSVERNRKKWKKLIDGANNVFQFKKFEIEESGMNEYSISLKAKNDILFNAIYKQPSRNNKKLLPLIMCLHGIGGTPEMVFGNDNSLRNSYHDFGNLLLEKGYAVVAPRLINNFADRAKINRLALLLGTNVWAIEIKMIRLLIQIITNNFNVDKNRIAAWGISMGGAYVLYSMPVENVLCAGIISAWFNHRLKKMVVEDPRYSCFLSSPEEHAFLPGLLTEFCDQDLISLICPRPVLIQTGENDPVSFAALVGEEFVAASEHYEKLGIKERIEWYLHPGEHEVHFDNGFQFLEKWL